MIEHLNGITMIMESFWTSSIINLDGNSFTCIAFSATKRMKPPCIMELGVTFAEKEVVQK